MIRMLLADAGADFTDSAVTDWPSLKPTTPFGQLPILIETHADGTQTLIPQSMAIMRHLARVFNRYGSTNAEQTRCDYLADEFADWGGQICTYRVLPQAEEPC